MMTQNAETNADVVDFLTADHQDMLNLLREIDATSEPWQRRDIADTAIAEVMRHSVAEEMIVYPVVEEHVPNGSDEVEHDKEEHEELVALMKKLEGVDASDSSFMDLVGQLEDLLGHHAHDEERDQFPSLRAHVPRKQLIEMRRKVEQAMKIAPTRPHPSAPHSEVFHKSVGPGIGMVDRLRDKLTDRQTE